MKFELVKIMYKHLAEGKKNHISRGKNSQMRVCGPHCRNLGRPKTGFPAMRMRRRRGRTMIRLPTVATSSSAAAAASTTASSTAVAAPLSPEAQAGGATHRRLHHSPGRPVAGATPWRTSSAAASSPSRGVPAGGWDTGNRSPSRWRRLQTPQRGVRRAAGHRRGCRRPAWGRGLPPTPTRGPTPRPLLRGPCPAGRRRRELCRGRRAASGEGTA